MSDFPMDSETPEQGLVDLRDSRSVELWCDALCITTSELVEAVRAAGNDGEAVAEYVRASRLARSTRPN